MQDENSQIRSAFFVNIIVLAVSGVGMEAFGFGLSIFQIKLSFNYLQPNLEQDSYLNKVSVNI